MQKIKLSIADRVYPLSVPEGEEAILREAAKRANTLRRSIDEAVQETARKSPRKLNPKEELERRSRLEKLEKWKREKEMKKREEQLRFIRARIFKIFNG